MRRTLILAAPVLIVVAALGMIYSLSTPVTASPIHPEALKFPWDARENPWYYLQGPHGWGGVNVCAEYEVHKLSGIDVGRGAGRPVLAMADGKVTEAGWRSGWGYLVELDHDGFQILHAHLQEDPRENPGVQVGMELPQGAIIGLVGCTGACFGAHLHIDLRTRWTPGAWEGVVVEGWRFRAIRTAADSSMGLNYRGTATQGNEDFVEHRTCDRTAAAKVGTKATKFSSSSWGAGNDLHSSNTARCLDGSVAELAPDGRVIGCGAPTPTPTAPRPTPTPTSTPIPTPTPAVVPSSPILRAPAHESSHFQQASVRLEWETSAGARDYFVQWWGGRYGLTSACDWRPSIYCDISPLTPGYSYAWRVKARNDLGESNWSQTWSFKVTAEMQLIEPLTVSPGISVVGEETTARFVIKNTSGEAVLLRQLTAGARGPDCADLHCPRIVDFPHVHDLVLHPGEVYRYEQARRFTESGPGYFAQPAYLNAEGGWRFLDMRILFTVREESGAIGDHRLHYPRVDAATSQHETH